ncbi:unnamed protein product [[Candida] boidinii]|uniref:Unnamed protein product n=1 Tax=Candida boidinii TaxID=5477 RepID=A0A9W6SW23_CANBO|nr:hypothetical protein BVG19_g2937 [[Candida] boidinii]OWB83860.1 hypothetical protein B5S33_g2495 [[Candida] boidinii]GME67379.1 unnamed protein product [[Candida] boidinii]
MPFVAPNRHANNPYTRSSSSESLHSIDSFEIPLPTEVSIDNILKSSDSITLTNININNNNNNNNHNNNSDSNVPLSLSFIRKPARSNSIDESKLNDDIIKQNTLSNSISPSKNILDGNNNDTTDDSENLTGYFVKRSNLHKLTDDPELNNATSTSTNNNNNYYDDDEDYSNAFHHPLVRKKSGELVKPSLKLNTYKSSASLPTTPTYKSVHFGASIDVKFFDEADKPKAISAGNSPYNSDDDDEDKDEEDGDEENDSNDDYDNDSNDELNEIDFEKFNKIFDYSIDYIENNNLQSLKKFEKLIKKFWFLDLTNFPKIIIRDEIDSETPIFLERMFMNPLNTELIGQICGKNLAYEKLITIKYTINNWNSIININANYYNDIPRILRKANYDRFVFKINLINLFYEFIKSNGNQNLKKINKIENVPLQLCVRYFTNGQEYWDNNSGSNYLINFKKLVNLKKMINLKKFKNNNNNDQNIKRHYSSKYLKKNLINNKNLELINKLHLELNNQNLKNLISTTAKDIGKDKDNKNSDNLENNDKGGDIINDSETKLTGSPIVTSSNLNISTPSPDHSYSSTYISLGSPGTPKLLNSNYNNIPNFSDLNIVNDKNSNLFEKNKINNDSNSNSTENKNKENLVSDNDNSNNANKNNRINDAKDAKSIKKITNSNDCDKQSLKSRPSINSKSYKELLDSYCFFTGPSTVSSVLDEPYDQ